MDHDRKLIRMPAPLFEMGIGSFIVARNALIMNAVSIGVPEK